MSDDGSDDATLALIEARARTSEVPIVVHRNPERLGFADNFLHAAALSSGRYIAFCDQDDRWHPDKLAKTRAAIERHGAVLCTHQVQLIDQSGNPLGVDPQMIDRTRVIGPGRADPFGVYFGFTMLLDRRLLDLLPADRRGVDNYDGVSPLSHDRWVHFLATSFGRTVVLADPVADYRQHDDQAIGIPRVSFPQRVRNKIVEGPPKLAILADIAERRAALLAEYRPVESSISELLVWRAAEQRWHRVARRCTARRDIYLAGSVTRRLTKLLRNIGEGAYRPTDRGGLGTKRLIEDGTLGLFGKLARFW